MPVQKVENTWRNFFYYTAVKNIYLEIWIIFTAIFIAQLINIDTCATWLIESFNNGWDAVIMCCLGLVLPVVATIVVGGKTLQFWDDLKNGTSR